MASRNLSRLLTTVGLLKPSLYAMRSSFTTVACQRTNNVAGEKRNSPKTGLIHDLRAAPASSSQFVRRYSVVVAGLPVILSALLLNLGFAAIESLGRTRELVAKDLVLGGRYEYARDPRSGVVRVELRQPEGEGGDDGGKK